MSASSDDKTIVNGASWVHWYTAPDDMARLIPHSAEAKLSFLKVVQAIQNGDVSSHFKDFMHWEDADVSLEFDSSDTDMHTDADQNENQDSVDDVLPNVTGFFRMPARGRSTDCWVFGCGRPDREVHFILDLPKNRNSIHGRHGTIRYANGCLILVADRHRLYVGAHELQRKKNIRCNPSMFQRVLSHSQTLRIGNLLYRIELVPNIPSDSDETVTLFSPTPTTDETLLRGYNFTPAFDSGAQGTIYGATSVSTGDEYVCKKVLVKNDKSAAVKHEIEMMQACKHDGIIGLKEWFCPPAPIIQGREPSGTKEYFLILTPAMQMNLDLLIKTLIRENAEALDFVHAVQTMMIQLVPALHWLHSQGMMHRDIKPDNIGVDRRRSLKFVLFDLGHAEKALTSTDHFKGTILYLAPEILRLKQQEKAASRYQPKLTLDLVPYGPKADVWAFGLSSAEAMLGKHLDMQEMNQRSEQRARYLLSQTNVLAMDPSNRTIAKAVLMMLHSDPDKRADSRRLLEHLRASNLLPSVGSD